MRKRKTWKQTVTSVLYNELFAILYTMAFTGSMFCIIEGRKDFEIVGLAVLSGAYVCVRMVVIFVKMFALMNEECL